MVSFSARLKKSIATAEQNTLNGSFSLEGAGSLPPALGQEPGRGGRAPAARRRRQGCRLLRTLARREAATVDGRPAAACAFSLTTRGATHWPTKRKKAAYPAYTEPLTTSKGTLWRVRVGPYPSRESAVDVRDKLKTEGYSGIVASPK